MADRVLCDHGTLDEAVMSVINDFRRIEKKDLSVSSTQTDDSKSIPIVGGSGGNSLKKHSPIPMERNN